MACVTQIPGALEINTVSAAQRAVVGSWFAELALGEELQDRLARGRPFGRLLPTAITVRDVPDETRRSKSTCVRN
jgi:hypothetical protein